MKQLTVITCRVGYRPKPQTVQGDLAGMQAIVNGLIERIELAEGIDLWINEEGVIIGAPANRVITTSRGYRSPIRGDFFVCGVDYETGESTSLTAEQVAEWLPRLEASPIGLVVPGEELHPVPSENLYWRDIEPEDTVWLTNGTPSCFVVDRADESYVAYWNGPDTERREALSYLDQASRGLTA